MKKESSWQKTQNPTLCALFRVVLAFFILIYYFYSYISANQAENGSWQPFTFSEN